ncbi:MAG: Spy/CpxP family protein refolding chaperone [Candidatus Omnitrophica bacterium]|nr:Spy/CpxP family protein refolding chaperone [Candidatus Omnitrophota bacterium]
MRNKLMTAALIGLFAGSIVSAGAYAGQGWGDAKGSMHSRGYKDKGCQATQSAMCILRNADELGLTEDQKNQITDIKTEAKRDYIRSKAEIDLIAVDVKSEMYKDATDVGAVTALIDKKYAAKAEKAKAMVRAKADMESVLTDEQRAKLKEIKKSCCGARGMGRGKMCPMTKDSQACPVTDKK